MQARKCPECSKMAISWPTGVTFSAQPGFPVEYKYCCQCGWSGDGYVVTETAIPDRFTEAWKEGVAFFQDRRFDEAWNLANLEAAV